MSSSRASRKVPGQCRILRGSQTPGGHVVMTISLLVGLQGDFCPGPSHAFQACRCTVLLVVAARAVLHTRPLTIDFGEQAAGVTALRTAQ